MNSLKSILSMLCGLAVSFVVFFICIYVCRRLDLMTHERYSGVWTAVTVVSGLVLGVIAGDFVKNLIYEEPPHFH